MEWGLGTCVLLDNNCLWGFMRRGNDSWKSSEDFERNRVYYYGNERLVAIRCGEFLILETRRSD